MTETPSTQGASGQDDAERESLTESAGRRGTDDRRRYVDPAHNPAPRSPEADAEAIRKGEEHLERIGTH